MKKIGQVDIMSKKFMVMQYFTLILLTIIEELSRHGLYENRKEKCISF